MDKSQYLQPRAYELMVVLLPDRPEEETNAALEAVLGYITEQGGTIDSVNVDSPWGRRRLAYTIRHEGVDYRDGYYALTYFTAMPSALSDIEREFKLDVNVIRYLLLTHDPHMGEKIDATAAVDDVADEDAEDEAEVAEVEETEAVAEAAAEGADAAESDDDASEDESDDDDSDDDDADDDDDDASDDDESDDEK